MLSLCLRKSGVTGVLHNVSIGFQRRTVSHIALYEPAQVPESFYLKKDMASNLPDHFHPDPGRWEKHVSLHDMKQECLILN